MASLTPFASTVAGITATGIAAAAGGDSIPGDGRTRVLIQNPTGGSITLTVDAPLPDEFGIVNDIHDVTLAIPAAGFRLIGPFPPIRFNDVNQRVQFTYSAVGLVLWPIAS
jgi:hypothetical protein